MTASTNPFGPKGWTPEKLGSQAGKTFVITGANAGAGYEAAKLLKSRDANVVMLCRNEAKAKAAMASIQSEVGGQGTLSFIELDLGDLASVRKAAEQIKAEVPTIDALIANAAVAQIAKQELTVDGFESQLGINHYGHFLLLGLLFEQVESSSGRIVVVGSLGYDMGLRAVQFDDMNWDNNYNPMNTYSSSKLAQMLFAYELQKRVAEAGKSVQVHVCHPGAARTELGQEECNFITKVLFTLLAPLAQSAEKGSWPEVLCATEDGLLPERLYGPTQRNNMVGVIGETVLKPHALDREAASRLWTISEEATGLSWTP